MSADFSIIIPAKNEQQGLQRLLPEIRAVFPDTAIIVVDDGSHDATQSIALECKASVIRHPYSMGNGAAIKTGARACKTENMVFMDADGQHDPQSIRRLMARLNNGYDMVVGARTADSQAGILRATGNSLYNCLASKVTGHKILDLTSGFRAVKRDLFNEFLYLLPNGFSYPTTITMAFFRSGYAVAYEPIQSEKRIGKSHIRLARDGARFFIIIIKIASLYSPLKVFTPAAVVIASLGLINYAYTYISAARFTNMSALLLIVSIIIFMFGLLAEQITTLSYTTSERRKPGPD